MSGQFDFDTPVERRGTDSEKWGRWAGRDVLPLWVADMDFAAPPPVVSALRARVEHGVFGYALPDDELTGVLVAALSRTCGWAVEPAWVTWLPGLVSGLTVACRAVGDPGDGVVVMPPVYGPFLRVPALVDRIARPAPLAGNNLTGWRLDPEALAGPATPTADLIDRGLLERCGERRCRLTRRGRLLADALTLELLAAAESSCEASDDDVPRTKVG